MGTVVTAVQGLLALGALLAVYRAIRGPTLADRIIALDLLLFLLAGAVAAQSARDGSEYFVPVLLGVSLVAFAGTVLVARFIEWRDVQ